MNRLELILEFSAGVTPAQDQYIVTKIINSTAYKPGGEIDNREVDALCNNPRWKVSIIRKKAFA